MGLRKALGVALSIGTQFVPHLNVFGPLAAAAIPGDKDDKAIAAVGNTVLQFNAIVASVQATGEILADKGISGSDKARVAGRQFGPLIVQSMQAAGYKLQEDEKFVAACEKLGGNWADIMDCFKQK